MSRWGAARGIAALALTLSTSCVETETDERESATSGESAEQLRAGANAPRQAKPTRSGRRMPSAVQRIDALGDLTGLSPMLRELYSPSSFDALAPPTAGEWLASHRERGQSFEQFVAGSFLEPTKSRRTLYILPIGPLSHRDDPRLSTLAEFATAYFGLPTKVLPQAKPDSIRARRRTRGDVQMHAGDVLDHLTTRIPSDAFAIIGLTSIDLYPEAGWNFVFGMARFRQRVGVHSLARYHRDFYGEKRRRGAKKTVLRRAVKVMAHEIGHMFGLEHCIYYECMQCGTNSLAESDKRPVHACPVCLRKLTHSIKFEPVSRYRALRRFYRKYGLTEEAAFVSARIDALGGLATAPP